MQDRTWTSLSHEFKADIRWFYLFATTSNGILLCPPNRPTIEIECDSSLNAAGGNSKGFYVWKYTDTHTTNFPNICHLEAINLLIAYKTFAQAIWFGPYQRPNTCLLHKGNL